MKRVPLNILLFLVPLFLLSAINLLGPQGGDLSGLEQRRLKSLPPLTGASVVSGAYFKAFDEYFADRFIFRDRLIRWGATLNQLRGFAGQDGAKLVVTTGDNGFQGNQPTEASPSAQPDPPPEEQGEGLDSRSAILVVNNRGMELFTYAPASTERYAEAINRFQAGLSGDVQSYVLLAPTQIEFHNTTAKYKDLTSPQRPAIQAVYDRLDTAITSVDAYQAIAAHTDQYLYFRTDHHWTALGAYYAYTAFIQAAGDQPVPLEKFTTEEVPGFLGTTYSRTLSPRLAQVPDTVHLYRPEVEYQYDIFWTPEQPARAQLFNMAQAEAKGKYGIFLGGDVPLGRISTSLKNGRKIAVIKDSYANAFVPFLVNHYEEIYVIDPRQFPHNIHTFIREQGIDEVLFLNYILVTSFDGYAPLVEAMMDR